MLILANEKTNIKDIKKRLHKAESKKLAKWKKERKKAFDAVM